MQKQCKYKVQRKLYAKTGNEIPRKLCSNEKSCIFGLYLAIKRFAKCGQPFKRVDEEVYTGERHLVTAPQKQKILDVLRGLQQSNVKQASQAH